MSKKSNHVYSVTNETTGTVRLVQAPGRAQARAHVAADILTVKLADGETMYSAGKDGIKVEVAGDAPPEQEKLPPIDAGAGTADFPLSVGDNE